MSVTRTKRQPVWLICVRPYCGNSFRQERINGSEQKCCSMFCANLVRFPKPIGKLAMTNEHVIRSAANTMRIWITRRRAKLREPSADDIVRRIRAKWPDLSEAEAEAIFQNCEPKRKRSALSATTG